MDHRLEDIWQRVDPERLRSTFLEMLEIYSPSGKEEDIQLYLEETLQGFGAEIERQTIEEGRFNLHAVMGKGAPELYLVGHVDTVPAWDLDALGPREQDGVVHGLGSADMKGGCAAMIEAWRVLLTLPENERPAVGLLLVVGEEENGDGSAAFLESHRPDWAVIGEPTGLSACFAHYGYLEAGFVTRGRRIHSSLPELGHNAVESMLRFLLHLQRDPLFRRKPSPVVYSIRELSSSRAGFVVPDRCEAWIDLHLLPGTAPETVIQTIENRTATARGAIHDFSIELDFEFAARGYDLGPCDDFEDALKEIYARLQLPLRQDSFRSHSDGNLFYEAGVKPVILGPGSLETAHTPDEQASLAQVVNAARIYSALCLSAAQTA